MYIKSLKNPLSEYYQRHRSVSAALGRRGGATEAPAAKQHATRARLYYDNRATRLRCGRRRPVSVRLYVHVAAAHGTTRIIMIKKKKKNSYNNNKKNNSDKNNNDITIVNVIKKNKKKYK